MQATWRVHTLLLKGDMAMWLSWLFFRQLLWFMGGQGCWWWWGLIVGDVVVGRSHCGWGDGCGMKKEAASQTVTHVTFRSMFESAHACAIMLTLNVQFCSVH